MSDSFDPIITAIIGHLPEGEKTLKPLQAFLVGERDRENEKEEEGGNQDGTDKIFAVPQKSVHLTRRRKSVRHQKYDLMGDLLLMPTLYPSLNALLEQ